MRHPETDMAEQIFAATERLMAENGLHNLSMHKIAKEAGISAGTIYIYFKSKEELLAQLAVRVFSLFQQALVNAYDESLSFFQQYRQMWWNIWHFLHSNPMIISNMHQYQHLPGFVEVCRDWVQSHWAQFCKKARQAGELCDLPHNILFALGLESAIKLTSKAAQFEESYSDDILEAVITRTWQAIQK